MANPPPPPPSQEIFENLVLWNGLLASNFMFTISVIISENKTCWMQHYVHIVVYNVENMVRLTGQSTINLLIILFKSNKSVYSLWTWSNKRLFSLFSVIVLLKYVLTWCKALKERSDVAFVAGITKISLISKPTCTKRFFWASQSIL